MSYTINLTDGTLLTTIADGTINTTSTSLTLIGKNYSGYGQFFNNDLVHILENSANDTAPDNPLTGQLWYDTAGNLKVYTGSAWNSIASIFASNTTPTAAVTSNLWWDTDDLQLKAYNGATWTLIGPAFTSSQGTSGTEIETVLDSTSNAHVLVSLYSGNIRVATISSDPEYVPQTPIPGFSTIKTGIQLTTDTGSISNAQFVGNATLLGGYSADDFVKASGGNVSIVGNITLSNVFVIDTDGNNGRLTTTTSGANIVMRTNVGGTITDSLTIWGANGGITSAGNVTANFFVGTAIQARYADLAERFEADRFYQPGTVVALGGAAEITLAAEELSEDVFGVVSTQAGFVMNTDAGDDATHPAIAVSGRVPVKVIGKVRKGDRLVSAGNGLARAGKKHEITSFNVIGRSLEHKHDDGEGVITAIVNLNS